MVVDIFLVVARLIAERLNNIDTLGVAKCFSDILPLVGCREMKCTELVAGS